MIRYLVVVSYLMLLCSGGAWAQGFEGLDLSGDDKKPETKKEEPKSDGFDLSPSTPARSSTPAPSDAKPAKKDDGPAVERDVTQDDRVKSVQRKLYMKRGRFELAPYFIVNINDAFFTKIGAALRAAVYPADTLAISARFSFMQTLPTDDVRTARRNLNSSVYYSEPIGSAMLDLEWSPIYGKLAVFNSILHFDGYFIAGAGAFYTKTTPATDDSRNGLKPSFDLGFGLRFVTTDWLAVNVALINTTYLDTPTGTTQSALQNLMMLNAGVSLFFPLKSTFREAE